MTCSIYDWLASLLDHGMLAFERRVLEAVVSQMAGETRVKFQRQLELIDKVQVDPFETCFSFVMGKGAMQCARIEAKGGLILARVSGTLDERPLTAEIGLCQGLLYAIVTNRPLSWSDRKRKGFLVEDVVLYPRIAPVASEWGELISKHDALLEIEIQILKPEERWLHPWDRAWYLCLADIGSQYYILQRCDENGELALLDYIGNEIVLTGGNPQSLIAYAYSHGYWIEDKDALRKLEGNGALHNSGGNLIYDLRNEDYDEDCQSL